LRQRSAKRFAAGEQIISRAAVQEVADTFDVLPRVQNVEERETPARIFPAVGRAELWAAGKGDGNRNGNGNGNAVRARTSFQWIALVPP